MRFNNENLRFDEMSHYNISGIEVFDRLVFGSELLISCNVLKREQFIQDGVDRRIIYIEPGTLTRTHYEKNSGIVSLQVVL